MGPDVSEPCGQPTGPDVGRLNDVRVQVDDRGDGRCGRADADLLASALIPTVPTTLTSLFPATDYIRYTEGKATGELDLPRPFSKAPGCKGEPLADNMMYPCPGLLTDPTVQARSTH